MHKVLKSAIFYRHSKHIALYVAIGIGMIVLIPFIKNDISLTGIYIVLIAGFLIAKNEKADILFLLVGLFGLMGGEYLFISMGVETFSRKTLLGVMPLWLPFLWVFIFLSMKRVFWLVIKKS